MKESKIASLEAELEESSRFGGSNEQLNALRKAKHDLQIKVKEQVRTSRHSLVSISSK